MPINAAICEDDEKQTAMLKITLEKWAENKPFSLNVSEYPDAESFLFSYAEAPCDILLLDIEMGGMNGMELAEKLRAKGDMLPIVFITGYSDYLSEGYDVEALHYLLKPVNEDKLFAVLDKFAERNVNPYRTVLPCGGETVRLSCESIVYIEARGRKTAVFLSDGKTLDCDLGFGKFAETELCGFVRCHRSYLVNLRYARSIGRTDILLEGGASVPLSRRLRGEVNASFIDFYTGENK